MPDRDCDTFGVIAEWYALQAEVSGDEMLRKCVDDLTREHATAMAQKDEVIRVLSNGACKCKTANNKNK